MLFIIISFIKKIRLKCNKLTFVKNNNVKVGENFKLADYTTYIIHPTSHINIGNQVDMRNFINITTGKNAEINIGNKVFLNNYCSINCLERIDIGENTLFGENVKLYDHNHKYNDDQVFHHKFTTAPISIGKNCWLGSNVVLLKGVSIGDNVIIGAGCVIHKDIPSHSIIINKQDHKTIPL